MDLDMMDPAEMEKDSDLKNAATKIQSSFRGHMARKAAEKKVQEENEAVQLTKEMDKLESKSPEEEEELDVDLTDPSLNFAAVKIQASFRGHMTRKSLKD